MRTNYCNRSLGFNDFIWHVFSLGFLSFFINYFN
jgi:hypothetical protein